MTDGSATAAAASGSCQLGNKSGQIKHVIYLQFDNTHYRRDGANVPSDLEQMPHLLNFLKGNGTLLSNDHTILISHTAASPDELPAVIVLLPVVQNASSPAWTSLPR